MRLSDLPRQASATVRAVEATRAEDPIARRLAEIGFVPGETVRLIALAPVSGDPVVVQVGFTRFALRRSEADRVHVEVPA
ncbi:MAG TPA: FeoA family protein [Moraxellaceae bacterium]|nr:FeoA family protein [Moraxellaceae bacterium]